jgi:hypothetical protein
MKMKKTANAFTSSWAALLSLGLLVAGCAKEKEPASQAIASIEATLNPIHDDAARYAAPELQQADAGLASLKDSFAKKDYEGVIAAAPGVTAQVAALQAKVAEGHAAAGAAGDQWRVLSADIPNMVAAIQSRVNTLGESKKLPKGLSAESFQAAQDGLEFMKTVWAEATRSFGLGNPVDAVAKANTVKEKGTQVLKLLGMGQ